MRSRFREGIGTLRPVWARLLLLIGAIAVAMIGGLMQRTYTDLWDVDRRHFADSSFLKTRGFPSGWLVLATPENRALTDKRIAWIPFGRSALAWLALCTLGLGLATIFRRAWRGLPVLPRGPSWLRWFSAIATWIGASGLLNLELDSREWSLTLSLAIGLIGPAVAGQFSSRKWVRWLGFLAAQAAAATVMGLAIAEIVLPIALCLELLFRIYLSPLTDEPA